MSRAELLTYAILAGILGFALSSGLLMLGFKLTKQAIPSFGRALLVQFIAWWLTLALVWAIYDSDFANLAEFWQRFLVLVCFHLGQSGICLALIPDSRWRGAVTAPVLNSLALATLLFLLST